MSIFIQFSAILNEYVCDFLLNYTCFLPVLLYQGFWFLETILMIVFTYDAINMSKLPAITKSIITDILIFFYLNIKILLAYVLDGIAYYESEPLHKPVHRSVWLTP